MKIKSISKLNTSIDFRLTAIFVGLVLIVSLIFSTMSAFLAQKIAEDKELEYTNKYSELIINVMSVKYDTNNKLSLDYSYWGELAQLTQGNSKHIQKYSALLDHLIDYNFSSVSVFSPDKISLYQVHQPDFDNQVNSYVNDFQNLNSFGDLNIRFLTLNNQLYIIATRSVYDEDNLNKSNGYLVFISTIDQQFVTETAEIVGINFDLKLAPNKSTTVHSDVPTLTPNLLSIEGLSSNRVSTYEIRTSDNQELPASIVLKRESIPLFSDRALPIIALEIILIVIFVIVVYIIIKKYVTRPIIKMDSWLANYNISQPTNFHYPYKDELGSLANNIQSNHINLMESLKFNQNLLNAISDIIITTDAKLLVTYLNPAAEAWFVKGKAALLGQPLDYLINVDEGHSVAYWFNQVFEMQLDHASTCSISNPFPPQLSPLKVEVTVKQIEHGKGAVIIIKPCNN